MAGSCSSKIARSSESSPQTEQSPRSGSSAASQQKPKVPRIDLSVLSRACPTTSTLQVTRREATRREESNSRPDPDSNSRCTHETASQRIRPSPREVMFDSSALATYEAELKLSQRRMVAAGAPATVAPAAGTASESPTSTSSVPTVQPPSPRRMSPVREARLHFLFSRFESARLQRFLLTDI